MNKPLNPGLGQMILRIVIGLIFIAHGGAKLFDGVGGTVAFFGSLGIPVPFLAAWAVTLLEFVGGIFLIVGLFVMPASILLAVHMLMGIILVHAANGFFVLGPGAGGIEFNLVLIAGLLSLVLGGPGLAAVDSRMQRLKAAAPPPQPAPAPEPEPKPPAEPEPAPAPEPEGRAEPGPEEAAEPLPEGEAERGPAGGGDEVGGAEGPRPGG